MAINANRHLDDYRAFGFPVWPDAQPPCRPLGAACSNDVQAVDWLGPLAGIRAAMEQCRTPWLATVPCDSPLFPCDLVERLAQAADAQGAHAAMASAKVNASSSEWSDSSNRKQPVFSLLRVDLLASLTHHLDSGGRKVGEWISAQHCAVVVFDDAQAFANANTQGELLALEAMPAARQR